METPRDDPFMCFPTYFLSYPRLLWSQIVSRVKFLPAYFLNAAEHNNRDKKASPNNKFFVMLAIKPGISSGMDWLG